jgi:flagellar hook-associated protein 2
MSSPAGGGKFKQFVKDIINAEREPIRQIESRKAKENDKLKLVQEFVGKVKKLPECYKELESFKKFRELKYDMPGPAKDILDVILDKDKAEPGEYQIEVTQLAGRHSMISDGYESPEDEIGVGYFSYDLPNGDTKSIWIGSENSSLKGLVGAINNAKGTGVQASLINDGSGEDRPWRVVVQARKSGTDNDTAFPDFYFLDGDFRFYVDEERDAQNAIVKFNGFEMMSQGNKFELLPGVTLDLKSAKEDYEFTLSIGEDKAKMAGKVKALVDAMNGVLEFVQKQNKLDSASDTSRTLGGDTALVTIESRLRRLVFESFHVNEDDEDATLRLSDIGVQFEKTGSLSFKEDKFAKVLADDFDRVANFFAGEGNFIEKIKYITDGFLAPETGAVTTRDKGIRDRIKNMDQQIVNKERNIERHETALKRQFAQLEGLMANMQGQQQFLAQSMQGGGQG